MPGSAAGETHPSFGIQAKVSRILFRCIPQLQEFDAVTPKQTVRNWKTGRV